MSTQKDGGSAELFDVTVVGAGPTGLVTAYLAHRLGLKTALVAPNQTGTDRRTTALLMSSVRMLETAGLWSKLSAKAAPLVDMRIVDGTKRLFRAPETLFKSSEINLEAFGYNIRNTDLTAAFHSATQSDGNLTIYSEPAEQIELAPDRAKVMFAGGPPVECRLIVGADGRNSVVRAAAGIDVNQWDYRQVALVGNFRHSDPHYDTSTEIHTSSGPFTMVPLGRRESSLVWVVTPSEATRLSDLDTTDLQDEIERMSHHILGRITVEIPLQRFGLGGMVARSIAGPRAALVGEAAHVFPPIGAQGLNLGLRDVAMLAELLAKHRDDPGDPQLLSKYESARRPDIVARTAAVDLLNRSLLTDFIAVQGFRSAGLYLAGRFAPIRKLLMREGVAPHIGLPRLMRGLALDASARWADDPRPVPTE